jgi:Carbohydrate family 9 binding domain-like
MLLLLASALLAADAGVMTSKRRSGDVEPTADPNAAPWKHAMRVATTTGRFGEEVAGARTEIRTFWTADNLYFLFISKYDSLYLKPDPSTKETWGLWEYDVVEVFIGHDHKNINLYKEFEVSPQNEWVDLDVDRANKEKSINWQWNSDFRYLSRVDKDAKVWNCEMRIPWTAIDAGKPAPGREYRLNLYRIEGGPDARKYIAWRPVQAESYHTPERFGRLRLAK